MVRRISAVATILALGLMLAGCGQMRATGSGTSLPRSRAREASRSNEPERNGSGEHANRPRSTATSTRRCPGWRPLRPISTISARFGRGARHRLAQFDQLPAQRARSPRGRLAEQERARGDHRRRVQRHVFDDLGARLAILNCLYGIQLVFAEDLARRSRARSTTEVVKECWSRPRSACLHRGAAENVRVPVDEIEAVLPTSASCKFWCLPWARCRSAGGNSGALCRRPSATACGRHPRRQRLRHPVTSLGWPSITPRDYAAQAQGFPVAAREPDHRGRVRQVPALKVVLIESGSPGLPAFLWRSSKSAACAPRCRGSTARPR